MVVCILPRYTCRIQPGKFDKKKNTFSSLVSQASFIPQLVFWGPYIFSHLRTGDFIIQPGFFSLTRTFLIESSRAFVSHLHINSLLFGRGKISSNRRSVGSCYACEKENMEYQITLRFTSKSYL